MKCHIGSPVLCLVFSIILIHLVSSAKNPPGRRYHIPDQVHAHSFYVPQVLGYNYPKPGPMPMPPPRMSMNNKPLLVRHETILASASSHAGNTAQQPVIIAIKKPAPSHEPTLMSPAPSPAPTSGSVTTLTSNNGPITTHQQTMTTFKVKTTTEAVTTTTTEQKNLVDSLPLKDVGSEETNGVGGSFEDMKVVARQGVEASATTQEEAMLAERMEQEKMIQIKTIDVACGKERMTVRVTFDDRFDGIIYSKGHYNDPNCRFVGQNAGQKVYQFDMVVGQCGVSFIDAGLTSGGMAYVEGTLVAILEPGVQEAWDAARRIRCLWEGNIDQTVTFPLAINMPDSQTLTFSGDTASASLEIQVSPVA